MVTIAEIVQHLDSLLNMPPRQDYCPNGLQVAGRREVRKIVTGVTASLAQINAAIAADADLLLVHHGLLWNNENQAITGMKHARLKRLLEADLNLVAYHLPLDAHPEYGNNARLGKSLGIIPGGTLPGCSDVFVGLLPRPVSAEEFSTLLETTLQRKPLWLPGDGRPVHRVAWCSGGSQSLFENAARAQVDAFVCGEASEKAFHVAREYGVHFYAAGHHATERFGVQALGELLASEFSVEHQYIEIENPV